MINNKTFIAIIPARGGSKRLPGKNILDLNWREKAIMFPLIIVVILIGIFPNIFLEPMRLPIENIINNYELVNGQ